VQRIRWGVQWFGTVGLVWLCMTATVWAQRRQAPAPEEKPEKTYVPSYMLIVFFVGFALMMMCRSGKRSTGFRREE
jgi:hypothetical protein